MQSDFDKDLQAYFTDVEHLREAFNDAVAAPTLTKRLLIIHGVGGVGKSSLLRMFRLHCKSVNVPIALASGDDAKSALDVLVCWAKDLKVGGVKLPSFGKTLERYRAIQAKIDEQARKARDTSSRIADIAGKAASKTAEAASGAFVGAAIGSVIPGVGTTIGGVLGSVVGGMGAEALVEWLRGFLTKPDLDLLLNSTKKLTAAFLDDIAKAGDKQRIVLLLDTFEQMIGLNNWVRDVAQQLHTNVLFVIAGRALPDWGRAWDSWLAHTRIEELKPMTEAMMRALAKRYYATIHGGEPDYMQVEAVIRFARGLPMVVTSAVQLWVKYGVEDFQSIRTEIVANLVDRLMEGVPNEFIPILEGAASVHWFDQPILRAVTGLADVRGIYEELRRFPFVRGRVEGLALHDAVREIMEENLRTQDSERYRELHRRAAVYFETHFAIKKEPRMAVELTYHQVMVDEDKGIIAFESLFEYAISNYDWEMAEAILTETQKHHFQHSQNQRLIELYEASLLLLRNNWQDAESACHALLDHEELDMGMRMLATKGAGFALNRLNRLDEAIVIYRECIRPEVSV